MKSKKRNRKYLVLVMAFLILTAGFIIRMARISKTLIFVYDQGRDALEVQKILHGRPNLIGPTTGIPGLFHGPFFYYLLALPYFIFRGNPVGVIIFLIILDLGGIYLAGLIAKQKQNWQAFLLCLIFLSVNYGHIQFSRWLSNPNPILWLAPLIFYLLFIYLKNPKKKFWRIELIYILGFCLGLAWQTELANTIFLLPTILLIFILNRPFKIDLKKIGKFSCGLVLAISPLIIFNFRHDFIISTAIKNHFSNPSEKILFKDIIRNRPKYYVETLTKFITPKQKNFFIFLSLIILIYLLKEKFWRKKPLIILLFWFLTPLIGMLFYQSNQGVIWDYYLISLQIPYLILLSLALADLEKKISIFGKIFTLIILLFFIIFNLREWKMLISDEANMICLGNMKQTIDFVYKEASGQPFNIDVFVPNLLPAAWEYMFSWYGKNKFGYIPTPEYKRERLFFYLMEPGQKYYQGEQKWRNIWYQERQNSGKIIKTYKIGEIDIEKRERLSL